MNAMCILSVVVCSHINYNILTLIFANSYTAVDDTN